MRTLTSALCLLVLMLSTAHASDRQVDLTTPDGRLIKLDIYNPGADRVVLLAPGQGCNPRLEMYDSFAAEARTQSLTLVRMYWAYCVADPTNGNPQDDLSFEKIDFNTALEFVRSLGFDDSKIFIGGKSLGSLVSQEIFRGQNKLSGLVLLTPVCTDPDSGANIFTQQYPDLDREERKVMLIQGKVDPLCKNEHFIEYLQDKPFNFMSHVVEGDHSLGIKNPDGTYNPEESANNIKAVASWIFSLL